MAEKIDIRASTRYLRMSPQKVRLVIDLVRGRQVIEGMDLLRFSTHAAAGPVRKLLRSAVANAEENFGLNREDLVIHAIHADEGPTRRWRRFGARGRFKPLLRRSSHVTVVLRDRAEAPA
jgi:large subunit ribosomal protein L22